MGSCSSLVSCTLLLSHPPEGDGILFFPGFKYTIIIIPSPRRGWKLVLPWFHVHYYYPIPPKGMGSCSSLVSCTLLLLLSHPPEGDGILFFPGFMYTIIIPSPRRGWDLVLPWFHVHYYYYYPIPHKGMGSCSSLVSCTLLLLLSHPPEGDGILFFPGFMFTIIPSPSRGWDLVLPWFHVHYYYPIPPKGMGSCSSLVSCTLLFFFLS